MLDSFQKTVPNLSVGELVHSAFFAIDGDEEGRMEGVIVDPKRDLMLQGLTLAMRISGHDGFVFLPKERCERKLERIGLHSRTIYQMVPTGEGRFDETTASRLGRGVWRQRAWLGEAGIEQHSRTICQMVPTGEGVLIKRPGWVGEGRVVSG